MNGNGIFIFTKNRVELLRRSCDSISPCNHSIYIIDDSANDEAKNANQMFCFERNAHYFGIKEQAQLISDLKRRNIDTEFFLKVLGDGEWNLGFARNHALILSAFNKFNKVLFLDDDVKIESESRVNKIFSLLQDYEFVGSKIIGMPDDSIVGHVATRLGHNDRRMHSGGCLAFRTDVIDNFFLNLYNEDWIWLYLQSLSFRQIEFGEAIHAVFDPYQNFENKILFQEIGEATIDGLEDAVSLGDLNLIKHENYWKEKFQERKMYLQFLKQQCEVKGEKQLIDIIKWLLQNYPVLESEKHASVFVRYFTQKEYFSKLFQELLFG